MSLAPISKTAKSFARSTLAVLALAVGAFFGLSMFTMQTLGAFSLQQRVLQQNDRIANAVGLLGTRAHADVVTPGGEDNGPADPLGCGCNCQGDGCGCGGCGCGCGCG